MSIFTQTFRDFVFNQLKIREAATNQKSGRSLGAPKVKVEKTGLDVTLPPGAFHTLTTSKQCIIRMSSGVDLKDENDLLDTNDIGRANLEGQGLAIRYILEGGVPAKNVDFLNNRKEGQTEIKVIPRGRETRQFTRGTGKDYGSAYGDPYIRSDAKDDFGIVPMPGIINAEIRTKTAYGSLRDAQINFVCHNRRQLDVLDALYMRPGMPILLEWGWSVYINNEGKRENYFPYLWEWFNPNETLDNITKIIHKRIELSGGNYDGFVGYVKNFEIVSRPDGGYNCSVDLAAMGEIVEGIKGKKDGLVITSDNEDGKLKEKEVDNLEYYLKALRAYCELTSQRNSRLPYTQDYNTDISTSLTITPQLSRFLGSIQRNLVPLVSEEYKASFNFKNRAGNQFLEITQSPGDTELVTIENILDKHLLFKDEKLGVEGEELDNTKSSHHYIRWDLFCIMLNGLIFNSYQSSNSKKPTPFTSISYEQEIPIEGPKEHLKYSKFNFLQKTATFGRTEGGQVTVDLSYLLDMSVNPEVCLLPHQLKGIFPDNDSATDKTYKIDDTKDDNPRNIGHIFIGLDYLIGLFERLRYKGEEIIEDFNLLSYLQTIWEKDVNNSCSGTHNFIVSTEKSNGGVLRIIDTTKGPEPTLTPKNLYKFNIQGNTSIVRDFSYNTTIDSKLSSTVAIAAQSPTDISSLDSVSFAAFNRNIQNRFFKEPNEGDDKKTQQLKADKYDRDINSVEKMLGYLYDYRINMLKGDQGSMITALNFVNSLESKIISLKSRYSETVSSEGIYKGYPRKKTNISKSTIIPLKFNCQIDGIGGLIIGNVFKIDKKYLPKGYQQDDIAFAVTTENQSITAGQDWTTEFSGQVLLLDLGGREEYEDLKIGTQTKTQPQTGTVSANRIDTISLEQSTIDPLMDTVEEGNEVYLKINNEITNIRTGTEVDGGFNDNIIGTIESGNQGLLLGTIVEKANVKGIPKWIGRTAGDPITEEQKVLLDHSYVQKLNTQGIANIRYERISTNAPVYKGPKQGANKNKFNYFNRDWNSTTIEDGYYLLRADGEFNAEYAFEQRITEKWFLIEFNEDALNKINTAFADDDKFINGNQGWMRVDVLQSSETF